MKISTGNGDFFRNWEAKATFFPVWVMLHTGTVPSQCFIEYSGFRDPLVILSVTHTRDHMDWGGKSTDLSTPS